MKYFPLILTFILIFSCKAKKTIVPPEATDTPALVVQLKKSPCYGECPIYLIQFYDNGQVLFNGIKYTDKIGKFNATLNSNELNQLNDQVKLSFNDALSTKYLIPFISDLPSTTIKTTNQLVEYHYSKAPKEIVTLEKHIIHLMKKLNWEQVKTSDF